MYFNHAFRKTFLISETAGVINKATTGSTTALTAGEIGLFDAQTYAAFSGTNSGKPFIIAQGSYFTSDKITPYLGGYQESVKSKVINPKYITRVFTACSAAPENQIKDICVCNLECGKNYNLRIDLKGSPALRFLSHNVYKTLAAYTGCCTDDCTATCTGALVDPTTVNINWATQIINDPILSQFLQIDRITDWDGEVVAEMGEGGITTQAQFLAAIAEYTSTFDPTAAGAADDQSCMRVAVAYVDTRFQYCTFTPTDFYELQPLNMLFSLTDESGDPCNVQCFEVSGQYNPNGPVGDIPLPYAPPATRPGVQAQGLGETVLRELILAGRYRQEAYPDSSRVESLRMREIEANPVLESVDRQGFYNSVNILHSVPRFNNPTGTFDNDQYLLTFYFESGVDASSFVSQLAAILAAANPQVTIENFAANGISGCYSTTTTTTVIPTTTTTTQP
jgi:hypothetical protein